MSKITDPIKINKATAKNRIMMPPLVYFNGADENGFQTVDRVKHYKARAKGGTGIIVVEASAVSKKGRLASTQLGLWKDEHIPQFKKIVKACKNNGSTVLIQIVHAGMKSVGNKVFSASDLKYKGKNCKAMTEEQIKKVKADFVAATLRAVKAGFDGVEIHGAHEYLLNQFTSAKTNKRNDKYGGDLKRRLKLPLEIVNKVREVVDEKFIISYRFGVNDPEFKEDIVFARKLENAGVDLLNVSSGIGYESLTVPKDFKFSKITYLGTQIKRHVNIPVASVYGIRYPNEAKALLKDDMTDIVAIGRGLLADANWANKAISGKSVNVCYGCKPKCKYFKDGKFCPWRVKKQGKN